MLIINPIKSNNSNNKMKEPDFGFILEDEQGFIRATYVVLEALCKIPDINCVPTVIATGVDCDLPTLRQVAKALIEEGYDKKEAVKQINSLRVLMTYRHRLNTLTMSRFPFCKIKLLNETQLNDICSICDIDLEYKAYKIMLPIILNENNLKDIYAQLGVAVIPKINLIPETKETTTTSNNISEDVLFNI